MSQKAQKKATTTPAASSDAGGAARGRSNSATQAAWAASGATETPYSDVYGKSVLTDAAFQVDAGQLTFDAEGNEGGRFHSRKPHVPPGPSGVTIGRGYDLGQHTARQIVTDMVAAGIAEEKAKVFATAAGLKSEAASAWVKKNATLVGEVTPEQQEALFNATYGEMSNDVQRISDKKDVVANYGEADIGTMNPAIRDTLVDLRYRGDYTGAARAKVQQAAAANDLTAVTDVLNDRKQWKNVPEDRFKRRAKYLQQEEISVEMDAYGTGMGPREHGVYYPSIAELRQQSALEAKKPGAAKPSATPKPAAKPEPAAAATKPAAKPAAPADLATGPQAPSAAAQGPVLKRGMKGTEVYLLQVNLAAAGHDCGDDAAFGPAVEAALQAFQAANGLPVTGQADAATMASLKRAHATPADGATTTKPAATKPAATKPPTKAPEAATTAPAAKPAATKPPTKAPEAATTAPAAKPATAAGKGPAKKARVAEPAAGPKVAEDDAWTDATLVEYAEWLRLELRAISKLDAKAAAAQATTTLQQVERFVAALRKPGGDAMEIARQPLSDKAAGAWVPPELVPMTRALAEVAEGAGGADWNSRLGAEQYRTQSDNLAAPEATCNVTSMAMVLERLGYSREDVVAAVDRELKVRWLKANGKKATGDLSDVALPEGQWGAEVLRYLDKQQGAGKAYQRLRGHDTSSKDRKNMAASYRNDAQMEDLVDFLLSTLGVDRTTITSSAAQLLGKIETTAGERPTVETLRKGGASTWDVVRAKVNATLEEGGSAMMSIFHKGAGQSGTHLIVVQQVTSGGMVVDDPYGGIRADYDRGKKGDAYASAGKTRKTSNLRNVPTLADHDKDGAEDDWSDAAAKDLATNERRGESSEQSDGVLSKAWYYVALYRRGGAAAK